MHFDSFVAGQQRLKRVCRLQVQSRWRRVAVCASHGDRGGEQRKLTPACQVDFSPHMLLESSSIVLDCEDVDPQIMHKSRHSED